VECVASEATLEAERPPGLNLTRHAPRTISVHPAAGQELEHEIELRDGRPRDVHRAALRLPERIDRLKVEIPDPDQ
jgi:hypothetical protein